MAIIRVLDNNTIDKIAAGEVVERPMSVVKELVENAIDANATIITVEIRNGGSKLIRVTDNGSGIEKDQIRNAFISHATSKIKDASDLNALYTLGFRGEALSSIAAVSRVEVTSRIDNELTGIHYCIEGGNEIKCEEVGAPTGTTFIIRDLFYNTLPRLKFLKSDNAEAGMISDLMIHLALSMPHISFQFINNGQTKLSTSGRGDLKEVIYRIFGREVSDNIRSIDVHNDELAINISGYLGLPRINRSNRAGEIFFINHRYIKSPMLSKAVETGYIEYLMQHKFPLCILNFEFDPTKVDVNVHPTKQEVRLSDEIKVTEFVIESIKNRLSEREMIDAIHLNVPEKKQSDEGKATKVKLPEQFETNRINTEYKKTIESVNLVSESINTFPSLEKTEDDKEIKETKKDIDELFFDDEKDDIETEEKETEALADNSIAIKETSNDIPPTFASEEFHDSIKSYEQLDFLDEEKLLTKENRRKYKIIGQAFKTYWIIEYEGSLMIVDQHAAHEKVNFERMMKHLEAKENVPSQLIAPPSIISVTNLEKITIFDNYDSFTQLGFEIEDFGETEVVIRAIPMDLYGSVPSELVLEIVKDLQNLQKNATPESIRSRIASMACKASIKGNNNLSLPEIEALLDEMLTLDNPYNCPHGRPTIIKLTQAELEKRFHRIV